MSLAAYSPAALARLACACEVSIRKAVALPEYQQISAYEEAYSRALSAEWEEKANTAIARAVAGLGKGKISEAAAAAIPDRVISGFTGWPSKELQRLAGETVSGIYRLAAEVIARRVDGKGKYAKPLRSTLKAEAEIATLASFSLADEEAANWIIGSQVFWIEKHFDADTVQAIRDYGGGVLYGSDAGSAGETLRTQMEYIFGVGSFSHKSKAYFSGVATNAATTARTTASMFQMRNLQVSHYTFVAVDDERTTEICNHLDGKTFEVTQAAELIDEIVKSKNPDDVRALHGWQPKDFKEILFVEGVNIKPGGQLAAGAARKVVTAGFAFPPLHFRCRSAIDISETADIDAPIETDPPEALPEPPAPPPREGCPWDPDQLSIVPGKGKLAGVNAKVMLEAPDGSRWLFKPYTHNGEKEEFRAYADKLAADIASKLDHPTASVYVYELPKGHPGLDEMASVGSYRKATGSIQRMSANVAGEIADTPLKDLTASQLLHVQKEHAFDWLISNHDGHKQNILILDDGELLGIDKGQAFKYFGRDRLDWRYSPNAGGGFHAPYMNEQGTSYAAGKMGRRFVLKGPKENPEFLTFLEKIRDMPDDEFIELVKPYSSRFSAVGFKWSGTLDEAGFHRELLKRKNGIVDDVDGFYKALNAERKIALPPVSRKPKAPAVSEFFSPVTEEFAKDIDRTGWQGKSLFVSDVDNVKSGNVLFFGMDGDGTVMELHLTPDGDSALSSALGSGLSQMTTRAAVTVAPDQLMVMNETKAIQSVKHFMLHLADTNHVFHKGTLTPEKVEELVKHVKSLKFMSQSFPDYSAMADHYLAEYKYFFGTLDIPDDAADAAALTAASVKKAFAEKWILKPYSVVKAPVANPVGTGKLTVKLVPTTEWTGSIANQRIQWTGEEPLQEIIKRAERSNSPVDESWDISGAGFRVVYTPHSNQLDAKRGRLRVMIDKSAKDFSAADVESALETLKTLGLKSDLAKPIDLEAEYLRKVTRVAKLDLDPAFQVPRGTPSADVVDRLSAAWSARLGAADIKKAKNYNPMPDMVNGAGAGHWYRFDITEADLAKYRTKLDLTSWAAGDPMAFFRVTIDGARSMISTETKVRIAIPPAGMSPGADLRTGGAFRVFTRLTKKDAPLRAGEFRFSRRSILDADNLNFTSDQFGNSSESTFRAHHSDLSSEGIKKMLKQSDNEICVKGSIPWDFIESIGVRSATERADLIAFLKSKGIEKFGSATVEDVVISVY